MKSRRHTIPSIFFLLTLFFLTGNSVPLCGGKTDSPLLPRLLNSREAETEWQRVNPQGEEFSIMTPVKPTLCKQGSDYTMGRSDERVLDHRSYGGYANNFNFYIESYKAARPKNLLNDLDDGRYPQRVFESEIKLNGFSGKQYRLISALYYGKYLELVTKKHVYLITLASKGESNTSVERFISSLILSDKIFESATGQVYDVRDSVHYKSAVSAVPGESGTAQLSGQVYKSKEVSNKAVIVGRPEPAYTDEARRKQIAGTVVLKGVFGADGQVSNLWVVRGLEGGLTGKAIEAALSIRFFPAEKDGQPVSQYIQIEYNFNLY